MESKGDAPAQDGDETLGDFNRIKSRQAKVLAVSTDAIGTVFHREVSHA